jgi:hypothetical protein
MDSYVGQTFAASRGRAGGLSRTRFTAEKSTSDGVADWSFSGLAEWSSAVCTFRILLTDAQGWILRR